MSQSLLYQQKHGKPLLLFQPESNVIFSFQLQLSEEEEGSGSERPKLETADLPPISVNTSIQVDTLKFDKAAAAADSSSSSLLLASSAPDSGEDRFPPQFWGCIYRSMNTFY